MPSRKKQKPKLQANSVTIGILTSSSNYVALSDYLRDQLTPNDFINFIRGDKIKVFIDGDKKLSYAEAKDRIISKEWDIAFTLSPMNSIAAKDNNYTFAAKMFPDQPTYHSALFVRANSYIQNIDDLKATTVLSLGEFASASSFYMPTYDLYGRTISVDMGHRGSDIIKMVKEGKADVGSAAIGDTVKEKDPEIRIIHKSREIPGSGVYLSPKLSESDRETIKKVLLSAPKEVQHKANYGTGQEPDYSFFRGVARRAEEVLKCADFKRNPVDFYCPNSRGISSALVVGKMKEWGHQDSNIDWLTLSTQDGKTYRVVIPQQIRNQVPGASSLLTLQGKNIKITGVEPKHLADGAFELTITQSSQLAVL